MYKYLDVNYPLFLSDFNQNKIEISRHIFEKLSIPNFMKIRLVETELYHAEGQKNRHNEANFTFRQFRKSLKG
jgi:hypothetical protein